MITTNERRAVLGKESASSNLNTNWQRNYSKQPLSFKPSDAKQKHRVYDSLLSLLQNKQIRSVKSGEVLPFALHELNVKGLRDLHGLSSGDVQNIEDSIFRDVENMRDYEIVIDAPFQLFKEFEKLDITNKLFNIRAVAVPGKAQNALICAQLLKTFSAAQLLTVSGFVLIGSSGESGNNVESVRLDVGEHLCGRGFMMPVLRNGLITGLKVFRSPDDEKPFILRSRSSNAGGQNKW
jgi:hypothetical protein